MAKSEKAPVSHNPDANIITNKGVYGREYSNGRQNWYLENPKDGENPHIGEDEMLAKYGYDKKDFPDQPLVLAMPEDYLTPPGGEPTDPLDPADPEPTVDPDRAAAASDREAAAADRAAAAADRAAATAERTAMAEAAAEAVAAAERLVAETTAAEEAERARAEAEVAKEALIARLQEDIIFMTQSAVAFEKTGKIEDRDKAFFKFVELFEHLAELKGWDDEKKKELMDVWEATVNELLRGDEPVVDADADADAEKARLVIERSTVLTELSGRLKNSRDKLAKLNVEASGRIRQGSKLKAELAAAREEWQALQVEVGAKTMEHIMLTEDGVTEQQMRGFAAQGARMEAKELSDAQVAAMAAGPDGGHIKKFMHKYARWYNEGGKVKKAILLAPGAILVGSGVGTIFGAIGGGIAAGLVARGAIKGALTGKMSALQARNGTQVDVSSFNASLASKDAVRAPQHLAEEAARLNLVASETDVSKNSRGNKKRAIKAVGVGAVIGAVSGTLANLATDQDWFKGSGFGGKITGRDPFGGQHHPSPKIPGGGGGELPSPNWGSDFSGIRMPVMDGKGFITDVESSGLVPKGYGAEFAQFLHVRGLDNGVDIPGFKNLGMWHTADGTSPWTNNAALALYEFKTTKGL